MITKTDAIIAIEKIQNYFDQLNTGRFDRWDHCDFNDDLTKSIERCKELERKIRNQLEFGEL